MIRLNDIAVEYSILPTNYDTTDINSTLLELCGVDADKFSHIYTTASSNLGNKAEILVPPILETLCDNPGTYFEASNLLFEMKVAIDMTNWLYHEQNIKTNPAATCTGYVVSVKNEKNTANKRNNRCSKTRHGTDIDVYFHKICAEVCGTIKNVMGEQSLLTDKLRLSKWDIFENPNKVVKGQQGKIKDIESAYLVVPKQVSFNPYNLRDLDDYYTAERAVTRLKEIKKRLNEKNISFNVLKTQQEWNGKKPMHSGLNITPERLSNFIKEKRKKMSGMRLTDAINLLGGDPEEVLQFN